MDTTEHSDNLLPNSPRYPKSARPKQHGRHSSDSGLFTPPSSQSTQEIAAASMLMSPPPEETLRAPRARTTSLSDSRPPLHETNGVVTVASSATSSKRKRNATPSIFTPSLPNSELPSSDPDTSEQLQTIEATPNPKPRKQTKRYVFFSSESPTKSSASHQDHDTSPSKSRKRSSASPTKKSLVQSPYAENPEADYLPPMPLHTREHISARRRSTTPIPPYEPPPERFTPPREVVCTPITAHHSPKQKSTQRKSVPPKSHTKKTKKLVLQIKKELPEDIDLSAPLPPPSPSDDPLLLYGSPSKSRSRSRRSHSSKSVAQPVTSTSTSLPVVQTEDGSQADDSRFFDVPADETMDLSMDDVPVFNLPTVDAGVDDWSSDEDNETSFDQSGEFTGKFKVLTVPTKADPPSSCTRTRMDAWGHPISPFPHHVGKGLPPSPVRELPEEDEDMGEVPLSLPVLTPSPELPKVQHAMGDVFGGAPLPKLTSMLSITPSPPRELASPAQSMEESPSAESPLASIEEDIGINESVHVDEERIPGPFDFDLIQPSLEVPQTTPILDEKEHEDEPIDADVDTTGSVDVVDVPVIQPSNVISSDFSPQSPATPPRQAPPTPTPSSPISQPIQHPAEVCINEEISLDEQSTVNVAIDHVESHLPPDDGPETKEPIESETEQAEISYRSISPMSPAERSDVATDDDEDDDEEDEVSVFRELSHPPDFEEEEGDVQRDDALTASFAQVSLLSSPNPFQEAVHPHRSPAPPLVPEVEPEVLLRSARQKLQSWPRKPPIGDEWSFGRSPAQYVQAEDDSGDEDSEDEEIDPRVIKITSDDPMAAARAAAILRMHKYNCLENIPARKRRHSGAALDSILRKSRRQTLSSSGISKKSAIDRRRSLGGLIGDKVYLPGSPAMTIPELLKTAETSLNIEHHPSPSTQDSPFPSISFVGEFKTPARPSGLSRSHTLPFTPVPSVLPGPREWSKEDWKTLDACYTDERLALGEEIGVELAPADDVNVEKVVDRFTSHMGGEANVSTMGSLWTREHLLKRARALQRKQRSGIIAPPTPNHFSLQANLFKTPYRREYASMSPPPPSVSSETTVCHTDVPADHSGGDDVNYKQLLRDAVSIAEGKGPSSVPSIPQPVDGRRLAASKLQPPSSLASRVKGFLFSYLPIAKKQTSLPKAAPTQQGQPLPVPPPEIFQKPRQPITTPAPKEQPKPAHPKELVQLNPAPPVKPSMIPRPTKIPSVHLRHVDFDDRSSNKSVSMDIPRVRRDSNTSVRDMVKAFEGLEKVQIEAAEKERESLSRLEMRRIRNVQEWNAARTVQHDKPVWRP